MTIITVYTKKNIIHIYTDAGTTIAHFIIGKEAVVTLTIIFIKSLNDT